MPKCKCGHETFDHDHEFGACWECSCDHFMGGTIMAWRGLCRYCSEPLNYDRDVTVDGFGRSFVAWCENPNCFAEDEYRYGCECRECKSTYIFISNLKFDLGIQIFTANAPCKHNGEFYIMTREVEK